MCPVIDMVVGVMGRCPLTRRTAGPTGCSAAHSYCRSVPHPLILSSAIPLSRYPAIRSHTHLDNRFAQPLLWIPFKKKYTKWNYILKKILTALLYFKNESFLFDYTNCYSILWHLAIQHFTNCYKSNCTTSNVFSWLLYYIEIIFYNIPWPKLISAFRTFGKCMVIIIIIRRVRPCKYYLFQRLICLLILLVRTHAFAYKLTFVTFSASFKNTTCDVLEKIDMHSN